MILSHGVVGIFPVEQLDGWGRVPIHLYTKFSSTLFFLIFGFTLGLYFLPQANELHYNQIRRRLVFRGLEVLVWYKILTIVQMFQFHDRSAIIDTLLYKNFPDFVEVLGFYGIFLIWFPFVMPFLQRKSSTFLILTICTFAIGGWLLNLHFDFGGYRSIKAILVEDEGLYTFGQLQRGAVVLFGLYLGRTYQQATPQNQVLMPLKLLARGMALLFIFGFIAKSDISKALFEIASNIGKHPPDLRFMSFSMAGALIILGGVMSFGEKSPLVLKPFVWIGQRPLQTFIFHIFIIFVIYRFLLDLRHNVTYGEALSLTVLLIAMTMLWGLILKIRSQR